jgi:hypothetical protein
MARVRRTSTILAVIIVLAFLSWRVLRAFVPSGAGFFPYLLASIEKDVYLSPGGQHRVAVVYNDAGAAHSGNHWTWIVTDHWLIGKKVVAEGYTGSEIIGEPFSMSWLDEHTFVVSFLNDRHGREPITVRVALNQ